MNQNKFPVRETVILTLGEALVSVIITAVYLLVGRFDYTVPLGAALGAVVTVFNFIFLSIAINRAVDKVMQGYESRKTAKPDVVSQESTDTSDNSDGGEEKEEDADPYDDEAARFAQENAAKITAAVKISYIVRTASVLITLVLAFITKQFNVLATVIPILCFRPILTVSELIRRKRGKA